MKFTLGNIATLVLLLGSFASVVVLVHSKADAARVYAVESRQAVDAAKMDEIREDIREIKEILKKIETKIDAKQDRK